jgi:hypothetical protein
MINPKNRKMVPAAGISKSGLSTKKPKPIKMAVFTKIIIKAFK